MFCSLFLRVDGPLIEPVIHFFQKNYQLNFILFCFIIFEFVGLIRRIAGSVNRFLTRCSFSVSLSYPKVHRPYLPYNFF